MEIKSDGSAGEITKLETSRKLYHSDGLRRFGPHSLIMVEGETIGTLDLITISGDSAKVETIQGGFDGRFRSYRWAMSLTCSTVRCDSCSIRI